MTFNTELLIVIGIAALFTIWAAFRWASSNPHAGQPSAWVRMTVLTFSMAGILTMGIGSILRFAALAEAGGLVLLLSLAALFLAGTRTRS